jgi:hypothetical protein
MRALEPTEYAGYWSQVTFKNLRTIFVPDAHQIPSVNAAEIQHKSILVYRPYLDKKYQWKMVRLKSRQRICTVPCKYVAWDSIQACRD